MQLKENQRYRLHTGQTVTFKESGDSPTYPWSVATASYGEIEVGFTYTDDGRFYTQGNREFDVKCRLVPKKKQLELKVGHRYISRDGKTINTIEKILNEGPYPVVAYNGHQFTPVGQYYMNHQDPKDLVKEVE